MTAYDNTILEMVMKVETGKVIFTKYKSSFLLYMDVVYSFYFKAYLDAYWRYGMAFPLLVLLDCLCIA